MCPTTPAGPPPSGLPAQDNERHATAADSIDAMFAPSPFTALSNLSGQPSISLPLGESPDGMPIGVMLTAQTLREDLLIAVAASSSGRCRGPGAAPRSTPPRRGGWRGGLSPVQRGVGSPGTGGGAPRGPCGGGQPMQITRNSLDTAPGPADWFTGDVFLDVVAVPSDSSQLAAASVHFAPGARTAWHTHPNGQTIFVTKGPGAASAGAARRR